MVRVAQRLQNPLIKEYTLNNNGIPNMIVNSRVSGLSPSLKSKKRSEEVFGVSLFSLYTGIEQYDNMHPHPITLIQALKFSRIAPCIPSQGP